MNRLGNFFVFRFSIREMLWVTLVVATVLGWWQESCRARQWRQRAEIAAGQIEAEKLGRLIFQKDGVVFESSYYDEALKTQFLATDAAP